MPDQNSKTIVHAEQEDGIVTNVSFLTASAEKGVALEGRRLVLDKASGVYKVQDINILDGLIGPLVSVVREDATSVPPALFKITVDNYIKRAQTNGICEFHTDEKVDQPTMGASTNIKKHVLAETSPVSEAAFGELMRDSIARLNQSASFAGDAQTSKGSGFGTGKAG